MINKGKVLSINRIKNVNFFAKNKYLFYICAVYYAGSIALAGQTDAHVPQETHFVVSITHLPSASILIAPIGHAAMQE